MDPWLLSVCVWGGGGMAAGEGNTWDCYPKSLELPFWGV